MKLRLFPLLSLLIVVSLLVQGAPLPVAARAAPGLVEPAAPTAFCDGVTEIPKAECEAMVALYNNTGGAGWTNKTGWLQTNTPCSWYGISCEAGHVTRINEGANGLNGGIPAQLGDLSYLTSLFLPHNQLGGPIPIALGNLSQLIGLQLYNNQLNGTVPSELSRLSNLTQLGLAHNQLTGLIPPELGNLASLKDLSLPYNQLSGPIPPELGNLSKLTLLYLTDNVLDGSIPSTLGSLGDLWFLDLGSNRLTGPIPEQLGELRNISWFSLANNQLTGSIPAELGSLSNLAQLLDLHNNRLNGTIPIELGNLSKLTRLDLADNRLLSGAIPLTFTNLTSLTSFSFGNTTLCEPDDPAFRAWISRITFVWRTGIVCGVPFTCASVSQIPSLECAALAALYNSTDGADWTDNFGWVASNTPCSWKGVSCKSGHVTTLSLFSNQLSGQIPREVGDLSKLESLGLGDNQITGAIPPALGNLTSLKGISLYNNWLEGRIPAELGNLTNLLNLSLYGNRLTGSIPPELGRLTKLVYLYLNANQLTGSIPSELGSLATLQSLSLRDNQLTGDIPQDFGRLTSLKSLFVSNNQLSNALPLSLTAVGLRSFWFDETDLCEPDDLAFQTWLGGITNLRRTDTVCGTQVVSGMVWDDRNRDGVQDAAEPVMPGRAVTLSRNAGPLSSIAAGRRVITGDDGSFRFGFVAPGAYTIAVIGPSGYLPTGSDSVAVVVPAAGDVTVPPIGFAWAPVHLYLPMIRR